MSLLELRLAEQLKQRKAQSKLRQLKSSAPNAIDFSSNDFLSLATARALRRDFLTEIQTHTKPIGSTGSRLLDGNSEYAESLERRIAHFHGAETGLLTNSGFDANVSIFMCLPQPGDVVVFDDLIHASVHDGMRQSRDTKKVMFKHNSITDLRHVLSRYSELVPSRNVFIAVESLYSMDGDIAPLREIVSVMEEMFPRGNCHLVVDEAHATGVYGSKGRGLVSAMGLERKVSIRLHTFGKALACNGAIILCSDLIKQYLINYARPLIYTTFMSYPNLSAISVVYDWLQTGKTEPLANQLFRLISYMHAKLQELVTMVPNDKDTGSPLLNIPLDCPVSPIFALLSSRPRQLAAHCQSSAFIVRAVMPPTVPEGTQRVRVCLHAGNTFDQIDRFADCVRQWLVTQDARSQPDLTTSKSESESKSVSSRENLSTSATAAAATNDEPYFRARSLQPQTSQYLVLAAGAGVGNGGGNTSANAKPDNKVNFIAKL